MMAAIQVTPFDGLPMTYLQNLKHVARKQLPIIGFNLLPTPVQNRLRPRSDSVRPPGRTAYLDGFRGYAALGVAILHMVMGFFPNSNYAYNGKEGRDYILQMPFFRLLYTGQPTLFFIISGYVLSLGTLKKARSHSYGPLQLDISSKIFRRGFRLYIPSIVATFIPMLLMYYHVFPSVVQFEEDMPHHTFNLPDPQSTLVAQIWAWAKTIPPLFWPFNFENMSQNTPYAYQLWTIPVEYRCSMVLFIVNSGLSRCTTATRLTINTVLATLLLTFEKWDVSLFIFGAIFAEIDLIQLDKAAQHTTLHPLDVSEKSPLEQTPSRRWTILRWFVLIVSLWILSVPAGDIWNATTFEVLETYAPRTYSAFFRFWDALGTILLLWAFTGLPVVQRFFTRPGFLYLGKLSFSLYLTHTMALKAFLYPTIPWVWHIIGYKTDFSYGLSFAICASFTMIMAIWMADLFHRYVEQPSADFTNWVDKKLTVAVK